MSAGKTVSFANFICKFGDKHDLLDLALEIIIPAFLGENLETRSYAGLSHQNLFTFNELGSGL